ncbi:hydroxymethylglutaryl-CoA reductase [Candidatus Woesearchaeota archaeon]|nr:hydroxymethylglutaryl-CoA reductase [Candidatus Woesearchaeota archaeon]
MKSVYVKRRLLKVNGAYAKGEFLIPLVTYEKGISPGVNRGIKAVNACGGVDVRILKDEMTRAPGFKFNSMDEGLRFYNYIDKNKEKLTEIAESTTHYGKVTSIQPKLVGSHIFLRLGMFTGDAAGHNMTTKAAHAVSEYLSQQFPKIKYVSVSSNYCVDKKVSAINPLQGRGKEVFACVNAPSSICQDILKTQPEDLVEVYNTKTLGSIVAGSLCSNNTHHSNIFKAIYEATGQDTANIIESSQGITYAELRGENLFFSVSLPCVIVGTVGGGTSEKAPRKALEQLGCYGSGRPVGFNSKKLAEIVGAAVLAAEFNLDAAHTNPKEFVYTSLLLERGQA